MAESRPLRNLLLREASVVVDGLARTWRLAPGPTPAAPLLIMLHGAGGSGAGAAALTGLATRGPAAGFAVAFPDGWNQVWNDGRRAPALVGRDAVDDVAFLAAMVARLAADGIADPGAVSCAGMSNGGFLAERLALPRRLIGPVATGLDATGLLLDALRG